MDATNDVTVDVDMIRVACLIVDAPLAERYMMQRLLRVVLWHAMQRLLHVERETHAIFVAPI